MRLFNTANEYGVVTKTFHWLLFVLIILMLSVGFFMGGLDQNVKPTVYGLHKQGGLLILFLMSVRLIWSLINIKPVLVFTSFWEKLLERTVHWLIYIAVIGMPLFGWVGSTAAGRPPKVGELLLPIPFITKDDSLKEWAFHWHNNFAWFLMRLLTIHVFAAFFHHVVRKDNVLRRMAPRGWV